MEIRILKEAEKKLWTEFVENHPMGSVEQSWEWGQLQICVPGRTAFRVFGVFEGEGLVGGMLVIRQYAGLGRSWLWCPKGPLLPEKLPEKRVREAWELPQKACEALGEGDIFLRVESCLEKDEIVKGKPVKNRYIPQNTLVLDLSKGEEELLAGMSQGTRRNIRLAEKAGVKIVEGSFKNIEEFYLILKDTAKRDDFREHEKKFYKRFLELLGKRATLWLAKLNGELVGGALMVHFGETVTYYFGASSSKARDLKVGHALQWHAILAAKKAGAKVYDFLGIAPEGDAKDSLARVTQFKLGFGGKRVVYQKAQVFVYRSFWWWLYSMAKRFLA